eukprot:jgi/Mesvir1/1668/Mv08659-RA.6
MASWWSVGGVVWAKCLAGYWPALLDAFEISSVRFPKGRAKLSIVMYEDHKVWFTDEDRDEIFPFLDKLEEMMTCRKQTPKFFEALERATKLAKEEAVQGFKPPAEIPFGSAGLSLTLRIPQFVRPALPPRPRAPRQRRATATSPNPRSRPSRRSIRSDAASIPDAVPCAKPKEAVQQAPPAAEEVNKGQTACQMCHMTDYTDAYGPRMIVLCSSCMGEFHISCLEESGIRMTEEQVASSNDWFCSDSCGAVYSTLAKMTNLAPTPLANDPTYSWQLVQLPSLGAQKQKATTGNLRETSRGIARLVETAIAVLKSSFVCTDELLERICRSSVFTVPEDGDEEEEAENKEEDKEESYDYSAFRLLVLLKGGVLVGAATIRAFGTAFVEVPYVATREGYRRAGVCRRLMTVLENLLSAVKVKKVILPAISEVKCMWIDKFGFQPVPTADVAGLEAIIVSHEDTGLVEKHLFREEAKAAGGRKRCTQPAPQPASDDVSDDDDSVETKEADGGTAAVVDRPPSSTPPHPAPRSYLESLLDDLATAAASCTEASDEGPELHVSYTSVLKSLLATEPTHALEVPFKCHKDPAAPGPSPSLVWSGEAWRSALHKWSPADIFAVGGFSDNTFFRVCAIVDQVKAELYNAAAEEMEQLHRALAITAEENALLHSANDLWARLAQRCHCPVFQGGVPKGGWSARALNSPAFPSSSSSSSSSSTMLADPCAPHRSGSQPLAAQFCGGPTAEAGAPAAEDSSVSGISAPHDSGSIGASICVEAAGNVLMSFPAPVTSATPDEGVRVLSDENGALQSPLQAMLGQLRSQLQQFKDAVLEGTCEAAELAREAAVAPRGISAAHDAYDNFTRRTLGFYDNVLSHLPALEQMVLSCTDMASTSSMGFSDAWRAAGVLNDSTSGGNAEAMDLDAGEVLPANGMHAQHAAERPAAPVRSARVDGSLPRKLWHLL